MGFNSGFKGLIVEKWNQMMFQAHKFCLQGQKGSKQLQEMKRNQ